MLLTPITRLINRIISLQQIPSGLKLAVVTPVFKNGERDKPSNYRPISVLPLISKILERVICDQLNEYLEEHQLLSRSQHGFRRRHSTSACLLQLTKHLRSAARRFQLAGHCHRHPELAAQRLVLWEPTHGQKGRGRPRTDFVEVLKRGTDARNTSELAALMEDSDVWRSRVKSRRLATQVKSSYY